MKIAFLVPDGFRAKEFNKCIKCSTTERPHRAFGLCRYCFEQEKRKLLRGEVSLCKPTKEGQWAKKFDCCQDCGRTDRKHAGRGLCGPCLGKFQKRARGLKKVYKREHQIIEGVECKYCPKCEKWKALDKFMDMSSRKHVTTADGLECYCKTCRWKYNRKVSKTLAKQQQHNQQVQRSRSDQRKFELLDRQEDGGCYICGIRYCSARAYDLHHLDESTKSYSPSQILIRAHDKWIEESKKCIVVCATCHRLIHDSSIEEAKRETERVREVYAN